MNIGILEVENNQKDQETFYNIIDKDTNMVVGILFTVENHVVYEIKKEFRGNGAATAALREVTKKLHNPVLEIDINNMASKRVALKAGYALVEKDHKWEIYKFLGEEAKKVAVR